MRFALLIHLLLLLCLDPAWAQIINTRTGQQYVELKQAIASANPHDILEVQGGIYQEGNILIDKPLALIGKNYPILDGMNKNEILTIHADSVIIQGFKIRNVGVSYITDQAGIKVHGSRGTKIRNNILENTFFGILMEKSIHSLIENNNIKGQAINEASSGNAIHLWYCDSITIQNNEARNHRDGIYLEFVNASLITGNISENNLRYGLHFMFSDDDTYLKNTFRDNGAGVAVMFSENITMRQNIFEKNWGGASYGLLLKEIRDSDIIDNVFQENTIAIYAEGANRCLIRKNDFIRNGWALKISGNCEDNVFTRNNFFSNTFDLSTNSKQNYNSYTGNYWSDYSGYDLNYDGTGDVPYQPVKLFSYVIDRSEASVILLRSLFIDLINYAEKIAPAITPASLVDPAPLMKPVP
jgi:nitrous oxidase accessory protein